MRPLIKLKACRISVFMLAFLEKNAKTFFSLQLNKHEFPIFACHKSGCRNLLQCLPDYSEKNSSQKYVDLKR